MLGAGCLWVNSQTESLAVRLGCGVAFVCLGRHCHYMAMPSVTAMPPAVVLPVFRTEIQAVEITRKKTPQGESYAIT